MNKYTSILILLFGLTAVFSASCGDSDDAGEGTLRVETWGEEYIEEGIPAAEFADGFGITYSKFLVVIGGVHVGDGASSVEPRVWDLSKKGPFEIVTDTAPAATYGHTAYTIAPAGADATAGNASVADVQFMKDNGYSVWLEGEGASATVSKTFAWGFSTATVYDPCHSTGELVDGGSATVQLTIHGDHLFYDSAVGADPSLRFAEVASADVDDDGEITKEELQGLLLAPLDHHGVGSLPIDNMWDYISQMTTTLGHIDGEGHCEVSN